jgi:antitoxin component YwqK of YwqJK toxin-antitoxin module
MKGLFYINLILACILVQACNTIDPTHSFDVPVSYDSLQPEIILPNQFLNSKDPLFSFHQDTLYYQNTRYSGYIFDHYENGDSALVGSYLNGIAEGVFKKWYRNNQLAEYRTYHAGKKVGKHVGFWKDGQPKFEFNFMDGELQGIANEWYQNGQPYKAFHYKMGYENGSQKMWWENGIIRANYVVKQSRRYGLIGLKLCMTPQDSIEFKVK